MKKFFILLLVILLVAAAAGGYFYQQSNVNDLRARNKTLTSDIDKLKNENKQADKADGDQPASTTLYTSKKGVDVIVTNPRTSDRILSPLFVSGSVPGSWSFEAQFPVRLVGADGTTLAQTTATLRGDWTTDKLVPFQATLTFSAKGNTNGFLVLEKDNPSGLSQNDDSVSIPVTF